MIAAEDSHAREEHRRPGPVVPACADPLGDDRRRGAVAPAGSLVALLMAGALAFGFGLVLAATPARALPTDAAAPGTDAATVDEQTGDATDLDPAKRSARSAAAAGDGRAADWPERVSQLELGLETGEKTADDADRLYAELSSVLWPLTSRVRSAIDADDPDLVKLHSRLTLLYAQRSRLFALISPPLRAELTGIDARGRDELRREAAYLSARVDYQRRILASTVKHLTASVTETPSATLRGLFRFVLAILVFRWWRRWARGSIPAWRKRLVAARPRRRNNLRLAKLLWYFERVRGPVEWLALAWVITLLAQPAGFEEISTLVSTTVKWLLIGTLGVRVIDAMVARGAAGLRKGHAALRLRSLQVIGTWAILLGLGLDLASHYAGTGVTYAWIVRGWVVLTLPVVMLLVQWWKPVIFEELGPHARHSEMARRIARHASGIGSYAAAAAGGSLLLLDGFLHFLVRLLSGSEVGRRVIAVLVRREVAREMERERQDDEQPIADEIILPLVAARHVLIEDFARPELDWLVRSIQAHGGGASVVIGERGAGKAIFLERVAGALAGAMQIIDCPTGGWRAFEQALADAFEIEPGDGFARRLGAAIESRGIRAIGVDNFHLLPRPTRGGQDGLIRLGELTRELGVPVSWVFAIDRHAWRYIVRASPDQAMLHDIIELPAWTEEQLAELVAQRAKAIELEPDYGRLVLPRQLDVGEHDDPHDRNRFGYARVLWELSDGNPAVALYLFAESLRRLPDDSVILRLPQLRSVSSLTEAHPDALLVVRALIQCDVATAEEVARSVRLSPERVATVLDFCERNEWVTREGEDRYRVSWRWFRSVTRALVRKNLMAR